MKTKIFLITAVFVLFFSIGNSVSGNQGLKVIVNGKDINTEAKLIDNRVFIPVRSVSEAMGADVDWDSSNQTVKINKTDNDEVIPDVIKSVSPCVVGVIGNWKDDSDSGSYSEEIIHGTGFIIKSSGEILTNAHVVKNMDKIVVVLTDGSGYEATIKYIDEESDLAVIKINKFGLPTAVFGKQEDIVVGKTVIAIGTPISFSLRNSASIGIISGMNRGIDSFYRLIQTDAAINPGNSGGPLVNLKGEIIGVNSSKFVATGIEGLGFSIPINTVEYVLRQFEKYGSVKLPYLGVTFEEDWAARVGLPSDNGLKIISINNNSTVKNKGIDEGDVLLSINNVKVNTIVDFNEEMKKYQQGESVSLQIKKVGIVKDINITLGTK